MDYLYQQYSSYFARAATGTEDTACGELAELGAGEVRAGYRGVHFGADALALYRITYSSRISTRILAPLITFDCHSAKYLYRRARDIPWPGLFTCDDTFSVHASVSNSAIRHSQYAALRVKDAIADRFRDERGRRPSVDTRDADVRVDLHVHANRATISLETTGGSTHRRGYRVASVDAPMKENVAAAVIRASGWNGQTPLVDPMCGSGTLLAEAVMGYCGVPAGYLKTRFGVRFLPDFDEVLWRRMRVEVDESVRDLPRQLVAGSDADPEAVRAARRNLERVPGGCVVRVDVRRFEDIESLHAATIVCNPPYGLRTGRPGAMPAFMRSFGDFLKRRCAGSVAYIYFGNREWIKSVGLRPAFRMPLENGGLDGRLVRYDLYEGSAR